MGLSSSSTKQSYTPSAQQLGAANTLTSAYSAAQPATAAITGQLGSLIPGAISTANSANSAAGAAAGYDSDVLGGKYLSGNPYLAGQITATDNAIQDRINGSFSAAGRTGSGANTYALAKAIGENENSLRYGDYSAERSRMDTAASNAGSLSASSLASALGLGTTTANLPLQQAQTYASGIGSLGIGGTTTQSSTPSTASQIGQALQIGALLFSDRRLKKDITRVGEHPDGLGIYDYRYVWGGPMQRGVMADEVERLRPWALGPKVEGFSTVDYGAL